MPVEETTRIAALPEGIGRVRSARLMTPPVDTYSYVGATETVARIHNLTSDLGFDTDALVDPAGDRLGVKVGTTAYWLPPDLHDKPSKTRSTARLVRRLDPLERVDPAHTLGDGDGRRLDPMPNARREVLHELRRLGRA